MATYSGIGGEVWTGTEDINIRNWSVSLGAGVATGAHSSSDGWTQAVMGTKGWTASLEAYEDDGAGIPGSPPFTLGATVTFELWDGHRCFTGSAVVADVTYNCDIEGGEMVGSSVTLQGAAAMGISASEPT